MSRRRALIVGASRGLGLGLVARFLAQGWDVTATVRLPSAALAALRGLSGEGDAGPARESASQPGRRAGHVSTGAGSLRIEAGLDIDDDAAVAGLRTALAGEPDFDLVFVVAGVATQAGVPAGLVPRATAGAVFQTNALSPIRFAEAFHKRIAPDGLIVLMTSKLGSVSLNRGGGWSSYRASKAALNTLARSFAGQHSGARWGLLLMHPGWVRTDLGGRRATLDVETSARGMVEVIEARSGQRGCVFLDHTGATVPW